LSAFTSDLSVGDFALCDGLGLQPLAQVMGSSIYQVGYEANSWPTAFGGGVVFEIEVLSQAWNEVRELALGRLSKEASRVDADAVIGVDIRTGSHDFAEGAIEQIVVGTAVRHSRDRRPTIGPALTELSVADYAKLLSAGVEPLGVVAWSSVFFVMASSEMQAMGGLTGRLLFSQNQELTSYTQGLYEAREIVVGRMTEQASKLGADGVIGTRIDHGVAERTIQQRGYKQMGLMVTFHAIGTAIRDRHDTVQYPPETAIDLTT